MSLPSWEWVYCVWRTSMRRDINLDLDYRVTGGCISNKAGINYNIKANWKVLNQPILGCL